MRCKNCKNVLPKEDDEDFSENYDGRGFCSVPCNLEWLEKQIKKLGERK